MSYGIPVSMLSPPDGEPPSRPALWRRAMAVMLAFTLLVPVGAWPVGPGPERDPFDQAVADLAAAPAARFLMDGVDARITHYGAVIGSVGGRQVMILEGRAYFRSTVDSSWSTGGSYARENLWTPEEFAYALRSAMDRTRDYWFTVVQENDDALMVHTVDGDLYITKRAPYRVLRFVAKSKPGPARSADLHWALDLSSVGIVQLPPIDPRAVPADLISQARQMGHIVDTDVTVRQPDDKGLSCSHSGCTLTVTVVSSYSGGAATGSIGAEITATVSVDGIPAGDCEAVGTIALSGTGSVTCVDPQAGPVFAAEWAAKRAAAQAEAAAEAAVTGFASVPYEVDSLAHTWVTPIIDIDPDRATHAGLVRNTTPVTADGGTWIPAELDPSARVIGEVGTTSPWIDDDLAYARANGYQFTLHVSPATTLPQRLRDLAASGEIAVLVDQS